MLKKSHTENLNALAKQSSALSTFTFHNTSDTKTRYGDSIHVPHHIRVMTLDGDPWFVAADVCKVLRIKTPQNAYTRLDTDEVRYVRRTDVGMRAGKPILLTTESGLYKLIMRSDKPEAKRFQDWVTRDVLPAIRKDGMYLKGEEKVATGELSLEEMTLKVVEGLQAKLDRLTSENEAMKPKAAGYEDFLDTEGTFTATQAAHMLGMKSARELNRRLHMAHFIYPRLDRNGKKIGWVPYGNNLAEEYFSSKVTTDGRGFSYATLRITPKGLDHFKDLFNVEAQVAA